MYLLLCTWYRFSFSFFSFLSDFIFREMKNGGIDPLLSS